TVGELVVVGDFDPEATVKQVEGILKDWKSAVPYQRISQTANLKVPGSRAVINTPDKENAYYMAAELLSLTDTSPDYPALTLANYWFGAGGLHARLPDRLRTREGLSYTAGSSLSASALDKYGRFRIVAICNPENIDKVDKGALEELAKALKQGITEEELAQFTKGYLLEAKAERGSDEHVVAVLRDGLYLGRTFSYYADLESKIAKLTVADVNRALRANLNPERLVIIRAGDFKMVNGGKK